MANPASKTDPRLIVLSVLIFVPVLICGGYQARESFQNLNDIMSDSSFFRFDREHHLPHGYTRHEQNCLKRLAGAAVAYSQRHHGMLPDLSDSAKLPAEIIPFGCHQKDFYNPATLQPFTPNTALSGRRLSEIANRNTTVIFCDDHPPTTYQVRFGVTLMGRSLRSDSPADNAMLTKRS